MKKFFIIVAILLLIILGVTVFLNKVILPTKIKSLIISTLSKQTGKEVSLKSLEFSIFKGLIVRDLVISDGTQTILSARQATCTIFIWPILKKQIIIPAINLQSPYIYLERRKDNSFNLENLFSAASVQEKKSDFNLAVFKLTISNGDLVFEDNSLGVKFKKEIKNIQFNLQLGLPIKLKFNFTGQLDSQPPVSINASGEYRILKKELAVNLKLKALSAKEFSAYYPALGDVFSGLIDLQAQAHLKGKTCQINLAAQSDNLVLVKDNLKAKLNSSLLTKINYDLETKKLEFSGSCDLVQADIAGLEFLGQVNNLNGKFVFNQNSLIADSLKAQLLGVPFEIRLGIKDFSTKVLNISTDFDLSILSAIAKDKFKFSLISASSGKASLLVKILPDKQGVWMAQGSLDIAQASLKLDKVIDPFENIDVHLEFSQQGLNWKETKFRYQGIDYESSGTLSDFAAPQVKLKLFADDLSAAADFKVAGNLIQIAGLKGKYLNSQFLVSGNIDHSDEAQVRVDLTGGINLELSDLNKLLAKIYPGIKALSAAGQLDTQFSLSGPVNDFKNCFLQAKSTSSNFSLYGFRASQLAIEYLQEQKIIKIPAIYITLYDGLITGSGALNLDSVLSPYQLELKAGGIDLGKLRLDTATAAKNKYEGIFEGEVKLTGSGSDLNKLNGAGSFKITQGKLGEINLLQGLGKLLLAKDLGKIEFTECSCAFSIKDKIVSTDKLKLLSSLVNLYGPLSIGFDSTLAGALDVEVLSENVPLAGTFKDVTTAIIGKAGKLGVIKLSGTLREPKYAFDTAVISIIQGLADVFFKK